MWQQSLTRYLQDIDYTCGIDVIVTATNVSRYRSWFGEERGATITEMAICIHEMNVALNITDILLFSLVTELGLRL